ncbi:MAG: type III polyketide synthase [Planctomycetota bacterium]
MMSFQILGLGTALPEHSISQQGAATFATTAVAQESVDSGNIPALIQALYRRAGVQSRHSVLLETSSDEEATAERFYRAAQNSGDRGPRTAERMLRYEHDAPRLVSVAAARALTDARTDPQQITHLVTVSCSGFSAPGVDLSLIEKLGLNRTVARTHVGFMGCHGALNGLRVARAIALSEPDAVVMICAVELCSLHHQYGWDPQKIVANSLFADGAAVVIGRGSRERPVTEVAFPGGVVGNYSFVIPDTADMMTWRIGDHGFEMTLSPAVPGIITRELPHALEQFLGRFNLRISDIRSWAIHPGGPRILAATAEAAGLADAQMEPSVSILQRCGNMSSPTVLFILEELRRREMQTPCIMLGFGPGLNVEIALLQ